MVLRAFLTAVLAMALAAGRPSAQSASAPLRFEAASIKPNRSGDDGGGLRLTPQRLDAVNVPAWMLVMHAHELVRISSLAAPAGYSRTSSTCARPPAPEHLGPT